jgi:hypothetical protein
MSSRVFSRQNGVFSAIAAETSAEMAARPLGQTGDSHYEPNEQKFFGSFFQKRTVFRKRFFLKKEAKTF